MKFVRLGGVYALVDLGKDVVGAAPPRRSARPQPEDRINIWRERAAVATHNPYVRWLQIN
jgi:hypothetical protein